MDFNLACPIPIEKYPTIVMGHGGGGRLMHQLLDKIIRPVFANYLLECQHDGSVFPVTTGRMAFATDSYVIHPLFFPGGDIGSMAVHGTVNDLAMCGAVPQYLSVGLIVEEGLPMDTFWNVIQSMGDAARKCGVQLVTGDTKVVDKGKGDGIYINTSGVGVVPHGVDINPANIQPGDAVILSGDVGRHGIAIMSVREGLEFENAIESDSAGVSHIVAALLDKGIDIHCLRDLTRGGLATGLIELASASSLNIRVDESNIPVEENVKGACEMLGFDPLYVANEGRFVAFVPAERADDVLRIMRAFPESANAAIIGKVTDKNSGLVNLKNRIGSERILDMLSGEQLPRIC